MSNGKYRLVDGDERARRFNFVMPPLADRQRLRCGDLAKVIFEPTVGPGGGEHVWVMVTETLATIPRRYSGTVQNHPVTLPVDHGERVDFGSEHIVEISWAP